MTKKVLIASLGISDYYKSVYTWDSEKHFTPYACLAILSLLKQKGTSIDEMHLFLTENAKKKYEKIIKQEVKDLGVRVEFTEIADGKTLEEVWGIFDGIVNSYSESKNIDLYLDITYGFRHLSMIFLASTMYLESLNAVKLSGVFYGAFESGDRIESIDVESVNMEAVREEIRILKNRNAPSKEFPSLVPIFDLTALAKIIMGSFAVKQFEESGNLVLVREFLSAVFKETEEKEISQKNNSALNRLQSLHYHIASGLPMEAGFEAKAVLENLNRLPQKFEIKALKKLLDSIKTRLESLSIKADSKKKETPFALDMIELKRELYFIKWHLDISNIATALLLLREWIVTRVYMEENNDINWLVSKKRNFIERGLGYWANKIKSDKDLFDDEPNKKELFKIWQEVGEERNKFAHAGMQIGRTNPETTGSKKAKKAYEFCVKNLENSSYWCLPKNTGEDKVLITPLGNSKGLLYTAIKLINPDRIVVLTSEKLKDMVEEICKQTAFTDANKIQVEIIEDPFSGFEEGAYLAKKMVLSLKNVKNLYVNFTGGTTAMQFAMQAFWDLARNEFDSKRVAFVDKRAAAEQQSNPYVIGEILYIDELLSYKK
jgi:hypothetical protein